MKLYYYIWNEKKVPDSHTLLREAVRRYLSEAESGSSSQPSLLSLSSPSPEATIGEGDRREPAVEGLSLTICTDTPHGKPYIKELPNVHFSISHSGNIWACAMGETPVGLDIQTEGKVDAEKIARRFFHPSEIAWLQEHGWEQFARIWAKKESYVKLTGDGLSKGLDYFSVVDGSLDAVQEEVEMKEGLCAVVTVRG